MTEDEALEIARKAAIDEIEYWNSHRLANEANQTETPTILSYARKLIIEAALLLAALRRPDTLELSRKIGDKVEFK